MFLVTKRSDILDMGVIGPLARFRKNDGMGRMIRNVSLFTPLLLQRLFLAFQAYEKQRALRAFCCVKYRGVAFGDYNSRTN